MLALLLSTVTSRLVGTGSRGGGGKGRCGRPSGALVASPGAGDAVGEAWSAWCWAALAFALALPALLRRRWRRFLVAGAAAVDGDDVVEVEAEAGRGAASFNSITSWAVVAFPPLDERVRVADLPVFFTRWYISSREVSSSPIFCSESEQLKV